MAWKPSQLACVGEKPQRGIRGFCGRSNGGEAAERRPGCLLPFEQRSASEAVVALREQTQQQRMPRKLRLHEHLPRSGTATGATGYLHERLRQALGAAEVAAEQALIRIQHHD